MESQNYIGIHLSADGATVVCFGGEGGAHNVLGCFSVSVAETEKTETASEMTLLVERIAGKLAEVIPAWKDCEIYVALDCSMFMQHGVHSAFADAKQIVQTIRFDTEEAMATDISDLAVSFKVRSSNEQGSELSVFTCRRKLLSDILLSLQNRGIDPVSIEPDIHCLSMFIGESIVASSTEEGAALYAMFSGKNGYFAAFDSSRKLLIARTFIIGQKQNREKLLSREIPLTLASFAADEPVKTIKLLDSKGEVDCRPLGAKLGLEASTIDLASLPAMGTQIPADCDSISFAIAYGAALTHLEKEKTVNFRNDFMPYMGKKMRMQKTIKILSVSVTIFMIALGCYFQVMLWRQNKDRDRLREKFGEDYSVVMAGKQLPGKFADAVRSLGSELNRIRDVKSGQLSVTGDESVAAKLALVLEAFNKCASQADLTVDSISINTKNIVITGETARRDNTLALFDAIREMKLEIMQQNLDAKTGRDNFRITVEPKK